MLRATTRCCAAARKYTLNPSATTTRGMLQNAAISLEKRDLEQAKWWSDAAILQLTDAAQSLQYRWTAHSIEGACAFLSGDFSGAEAPFAAAVEECEAAAREGIAHDSYVDIVGALSDLAGAKALGRGSAEDAFTHLKRGSYMARRAYAPDIDMLAVIDTNFSVVSARMGDIEGARNYVASALGRSVPGTLTWATAASNANVFAQGFDDADDDVLTALEAYPYELDAAKRRDLAWLLSSAPQRILLPEDPEEDDVTELVQ